MASSKQRFVLDANVIVSAALSAHSKSRQAFDFTISTGIVLISDEVVAELSEVLLRPKFDKYSNRDKREAFLDEFLGIAQFVEIKEQINECRDSKDNKYLELAA
jgi:uncharacterized protein